MGNKLIKSKSIKPLTLNESIDSTPNNKKYITNKKNKLFEKTQKN